MFKDRSTKKFFKVLLYVLLYFVGSLIVCELGAIHPIMFVCYQITAGILLTGVLVKGFDCIKAPGVALLFAGGILLAFLIAGEFSVWHSVPLVVIALAAEGIGLIMGNDKWKAIVIKSAIMSFSTFGFYGQIWLNRDYTYECAVEEMPAGYADTLMDCSPMWAFPVVLILGIAASVLVANVTAKLFKIEKQ